MIKCYHGAWQYSDDNESGAAFLIRILQYLETPHYLTKSLFPKDTSSYVLWVFCLHLMLHIICANMNGLHTVKNVLTDTVLEPGVRVTVAMGTNRNLDAD